MNNSQNINTSGNHGDGDHPVMAEHITAAAVRTAYDDVMSTLSFGGERVEQYVATLKPLCVHQPVELSRFRRNAVPLQDYNVSVTLRSAYRDLWAGHTETHRVLGSGASVDATNYRLLAQLLCGHPGVMSSKLTGTANINTVARFFYDGGPGSIIVALLGKPSQSWQCGGYAATPFDLLKAVSDSPLLKGQSAGVVLAIAEVLQHAFARAQIVSDPSFQAPLMVRELHPDVQLVDTDEISREFGRQMLLTSLKECTASLAVDERRRYTVGALSQIADSAFRPFGRALSYVNSHAPVLSTLVRAVLHHLDPTNPALRGDIAEAIARSPVVADAATSYTFFHDACAYLLKQATVKVDDGTVSVGPGTVDITNEVPHDRFEAVAPLLLATLASSKRYSEVPLSDIAKHWGLVPVRDRDGNMRAAVMYRHEQLESRAMSVVSFRSHVKFGGESAAIIDEASGRLDRTVADAYHQLPSGCSPQTAARELARQLTTAFDLDEDAELEGLWALLPHDVSAESILPLFADSTWYRSGEIGVEPLYQVATPGQFARGLHQGVLIDGVVRSTSLIDVALAVAARETEPTPFPTRPQLLPANAMGGIFLPYAEDTLPSTASLRALTYKIESVLTTSVEGRLDASLLNAFRYEEGASLVVPRVNAEILALSLSGMAMALAVSRAVPSHQARRLMGRGVASTFITTSVRGVSPAFRAHVAQTVMRDQLRGASAREVAALRASLRQAAVQGAADAVAFAYFWALQGVAVCKTSPSDGVSVLMNLFLLDEFAEQVSQMGSDRMQS